MKKGFIGVHAGDRFLLRVHFERYPFNGSIIGEPPTELVRKKCSATIFTCTAISVILTSITIWLGLF